ncbi:Uncharacterised protein [Streptococcus pneumoniae]|nr:Uncharacterised protein [Streptococcus pneumoniae]
MQESLMVTTYTSRYIMDHDLRCRTNFHLITSHSDNTRSTSSNPHDFHRHMPLISTQCCIDFTTSIHITTTRIDVHLHIFSRRRQYNILRSSCIHVYPIIKPAVIIGYNRSLNLNDCHPHFLLSLFRFHPDSS